MKIETDEFPLNMNKGKRKQDVLQDSTFVMTSQAVNVHKYIKSRMCSRVNSLATLVGTVQAPVRGSS